VCCNCELLTCLLVTTKQSSQHVTCCVVSCSCCPRERYCGRDRCCRADEVCFNGASCCHKHSLCLNPITLEPMCCHRGICAWTGPPIPSQALGLPSTAVVSADVPNEVLPEVSQNVCCGRSSLWPPELGGWHVCPYVPWPLTCCPPNTICTTGGQCCR